ncbi:MAG: PDC sensor domain-containing protein [Hydrogenothermaceae bacterium]
MDRLTFVLESVKDEFCSEFNFFFEGKTLQEIQEESFIEELFINYPFVELYYILDKNGLQISDNFVNPIFIKKITKLGKGVDRSSRVYYKEVIKQKKCIITKPYKSISTPDITSTIAIPIIKNEEIEYIICLDLNLKALASQYEPSPLKRKFEIFTKFSYGLFSFFLVFIALKLFILGIDNILPFTLNEQHIFETVILITLSLAIFDLAKTIFEEEVILFKDPRRHSEIRKTITRFLASIIIAVSIEALMLVFKFTISDPSKLLYALGLFFGIGFLIVSLGIYVLLGSKAEISIKKFEKLNSK